MAFDRYAGSGLTFESGATFKAFIEVRRGLRERRPVVTISADVGVHIESGAWFAFRVDLHRGEPHTFLAARGDHEDHPSPRRARHGGLTSEGKRDNTNHCETAQEPPHPPLDHHEHIIENTLRSIVVCSGGLGSMSEVRQPRGNTVQKLENPRITTEGVSVAAQRRR